MAGKSSPCGFFTLESDAICCWLCVYISDKKNCGRIKSGGIFKNVGHKNLKKIKDKILLYSKLNFINHWNNWNSKKLHVINVWAINWRVLCNQEKNFIHSINRYNLSIKTRGNAFTLYRVNHSHQISDTKHSQLITMQ